MTKAELLKQLEPFTDDCKILLHSEDSDLFMSGFKIIYKTVKPFQGDNSCFKISPITDKIVDSEGALIITMKKIIPR